VEGNPALVEVKLTRSIDEFFLDAIGLGGLLDRVSARAVASVQPVPHCNIGTPPVQRDDLLPGCDTPGTTGTTSAATAPHCTFDPPVANPDDYLSTVPPCLGPIEGGIDGAVAFVMSRACDAISYQGAGGGSIGAFVTNGGLQFLGSKPKKVARLGYNQSGCPADPARPPSGTGACTDAANELCVKVLDDLSARVPMNWPLTPPAVPTPLPAGTTWDRALHYPSRCIPITATSFSSSSGPPGIYCFTPSGDKLTITGDLTSGQGYTFFALNGSRIEVNSNPSKVKFYWPTACGTRPTSRLSSGCFGLTSAYDPQTLFYGTSSAHDPSRCDRNAICLHGGNANLDGDMFAVEPGTFPPPNPTTTGGTVFVAGGSASAGSGFIETWWLAIQGNTGNYAGTGMNVGGVRQQGTYVPGDGEHCYIGDPPEQRDDLLPGCSTPGETGTVTTGGGTEHCYIGAPPVQRDDLLPGCELPGETGTVVTTGGDFGIDE
jgi:hypothetical protein